MKRSFTLVFLSILLAASNGDAQTTYTISSNTSWNSLIGGGCSNCVFNIGTGVTLSMDKAMTCNTCTFNGGMIVISQDIVCQPCTFSNNNITLNSKMLKPNSGTTSFSGVTMTVNGTGYVLANTAVTITNSSFTFNNTSYFSNNSSTLDMTASVMYFNNNAYFTANGGPVNLKSTSRLVAGDGTISSTAHIYMNGPTLNVYDNSSIVVKNANNYYFNWAAYKSPTNSQTYSTYPNSFNCNGAYPHACSSPYAYGGVILNSSGIAPASILPIVLGAFYGEYENNQVDLIWSTESESNVAAFAIERSSDDFDWKEIGSVPATGDESGSHYSFRDGAVFAANPNYRLRITDKNGQITYSKVIYVSTETQKAAVNIFPNPITNLSFTVKLAQAGTADLTVYASDGRLLYVASLQGQSQYSVRLPASAAASKLLVVHVKAEGKTNSFTVLNK